jgi:hypothetical protein
MVERPVDLDSRRTPENQIATKFRRHARQDYEANQSRLRLVREKLEVQPSSEPATNWHDAGLKAQYLIRKYSETADARDARRQRLIRLALEDLARLLREEELNQ